MGAQCNVECAPGRSGAKTQLETHIADKKTSERTRTFAKVRRSLLRAVEQLQLYTYFTKPLYKSPGAAYDALIAGRTPPLSKKHFLASARDIEFPGNAELVFETLQDGTGHIQRSTFVLRLHRGNSMMRQLDLAKIAALAKAAQSGKAAEASAEALKRWQSKRKQSIQSSTKQRYSKRINWAIVRRSDHAENGNPMRQRRRLHSDTPTAWLMNRKNELGSVAKPRGVTSR